MHVVLVEPEIHWNTGNIGRTCLGVGAALHLVGPLGFSLDAKEVRRAGLDYWEKVDVRRHRSWEAFLEAERPAPSLIIGFSAEAERQFWDAPYQDGGYLVFGRESTGLPTGLRGSLPLFAIPHGSHIRSLNLSTAVGIALYEAIRRTRPT